MKKILFLILSMVMMCVSCKTTEPVYVPVQSQSVYIDTLRMLQYRVDTLYQRDSVIMVQRGDTLYLRELQIRERIRERVDTVYKAHTDTVRVEVPVMVEKPKKVTVVERVKEKVSDIIVVILILICVIIAVKIWRWKA